MNLLTVIRCIVFVISVYNVIEVESMIGGDPAGPGQFPYQVSVENLEFSICGGAIVHSWHVVTAGHCIVDEDNAFIDYPLRVVAGIHHLSSRAESKVTIDVERVFAHKSYNRSAVDRVTGKKLRNYYADVAVLRLRYALQTYNNPFVKALAVPDSALHVGKRVIVSGFGVNGVQLTIEPETRKEKEIENYTTGRLRYAEAVVMTHCKYQYSYYTRIYDTQLCAQIVQRDPNVPEGVCSGDSGSPLVYGDQLIGILNASPTGCDEKKAPGIYVSVFCFLEFINNVVAYREESDSRIRSAYLKYA